MAHLALPEEETLPPKDPLFLELARAGLAVETAFGRPQDVEWALDGFDLEAFRAAFDVVARELHMQSRLSRSSARP